MRVARASGTCSGRPPDSANYPAELRNRGGSYPDGGVDSATQQEPSASRSRINTSTHLRPGRACASRYGAACRARVHLDGVPAAPRLVGACGAMKPPPNADGGDDDGDLTSVGDWLEAHSEELERWLRDGATDELRQRVQRAVLPPTCNSSSATPDHLRFWLAASPLRTGGQQPQNVRPRRTSSELESMDESELFMELIRDVANELDIDVLCHKILKNVSLLTHADRGSLFLARGSPDDRYLVAKLFDVRHDTALEEAVEQAKMKDIRIPFGRGIAGTVAKYKTLVNIKDAYKVSMLGGSSSSRHRLVKRFHFRNRRTLHLRARSPELLAHLRQQPTVSTNLHL